jgi:cation:H+ antiporter
MSLSLAFVVAGFVLLILGGDRLVLAAARLSCYSGMSPVLVGALIVGMGTSAPEWLVSVLAAARGSLDLSMGNVVGSNVANLTLVLGASVLVAPIAGQGRTLRREGVLMLAAMALLTLLAWNNRLELWEGLLLLGSMGAAILLLIRWAHRDALLRQPVCPGTEEDDKDGRNKTIFVEILIGTLALGATLTGAELLVRGAQDLAQQLGFSEGFIGLTLVAVGTSLPELATALAAAHRGENDILVGNLMGSNLFNSLAIMGSAALMGQIAVQYNFQMVLATMMGVTLLAGVFAVTGNRLIRTEGLLLLVAYGGFIGLNLF